MELKQCSSCKQQKSLESFYKLHDGTRSECKECTRKREKARREKLVSNYQNLSTQTSLREKQCPKCAQIKSIAAFSITRSRPDGRCALCKDCARDSFNKWKNKDPERAYRLRRSAQIKHLYGVDMAWYEAKLDEQEHKCAICGVTENQTGGITTKLSFAVDHNHKTGAVRGLLCNTCNSAVGSLKDSPALAIKAANYLTSYEESNE